MTKITYKLFNGEKIDIEVGDSIAKAIEEMETFDKRTRWRDHKRRELSLNDLFEKGYEPIDTGQNVQALAELNADTEVLYKVLAGLSAENRQLIFKVYFEGAALKDLALKEGITYQAIQNRLKRLLRKIKKHFI